MNAATDVRNQPCILPCAYACTESAVQQGMEAGAIDSRQVFCEQGYSGLQIVILSIIRSPHRVLSYRRIAQLVVSAYGLEATEGAVRGAVERLRRYELFVPKSVRRGQLRGNQYTLVTDPCPHIPPLHRQSTAIVQANMETGVQLRPRPPVSILKQTDRQKNLSVSSENREASTAILSLEKLTEGDILFHWPVLVQHGFGTDQIRQIITRLAQKNLGAERVMQGLAHAEWELANNCMCDKSGEPVASPLDWTFAILARQGYYPRPAGYCSPEERADLDAAEAARKRATAHQKRLNAEFEAWSVLLASDERRGILGAQNGPLPRPANEILRQHFLATVWPALQDKTVEQP